MKLKAIQAFSSGAEGVIANGQEFTTSDERAKFLIDGGFAVSAEIEIQVQVTTKK